MVPKIVSATYVSPLSVAITFSDGKEQTVNVGEFIRKHPHPQYNSYLKEPKFKKFKVENGLLVWERIGILSFLRRIFIMGIFRINV